MTGIKNINKAEVMALKDQVEYHDGQVVSKTLAQNEHVSVTLFSFVTIDGEEYILKEGDSIVMPAKHPHAVYGQEQFKMLLVVIF